MRKLSYMVAAVLFALVGCEKPGPIELLHEEYPEPFEVTFFPVQNQDTLIVSEYSYDLTGLTPQEEEKYPGTILVNGVKADMDGYSYVYSYSRVVLVDKHSPIPVVGQFGQITTYPRLDVGVVKVNEIPLERKEVFTQIRSITTLPIRTGVFYRLVNEGNAYTVPFLFRANQLYGVTAEGRGSVASFTEVVATPDEITVLEPKPYGLLFRDEDIVVRWKGKPGQQLIVLVSAYDEKRLRPGKPLVQLKSSVQSNGLRIPNKLVQLIPKTASGKYLLTVVSANRTERTIAGYTGTVLVQAASIHNVGITLK
jgi:hypothetical protein